MILRALGRRCVRTPPPLLRLAVPVRARAVTVRRFASRKDPVVDMAARNEKIAMYLASIVVGAVGMSYAAVPLYKAFCQATGYGGTTQVAKQAKLATLEPVAGAREITITFNAEVSDALPWSFVPQSKTIKVVPGEMALAFYTATNRSDEALIGVSTYNVLPMKAGVHFNKIQCFCFDEQRLQPNEEVDMPVSATPSLFRCRPPPSLSLSLCTR